MALFGKKRDEGGDTLSAIPDPIDKQVEGGGKRSNGKSNPENFTWDSPFRPSAFLLPNYLTKRRALAKAKKRTSFLVVWGLLALTIVCLGSFALRYMANVERGAAEAARNEQQTQLKSLAEVSGFFTGLKLREDTVQQTLNADVNYSKVIGAINDALPDGGSISILTTQYGKNCPGPDPFVPVQSIGCVDFTVNLLNDADVETFISRANSKDAKNVVSFLISSVTNTQNTGVSVVGTANFTANTFTYRFSQDPKSETPETAPAESESPGTPLPTQNAQSETPETPLPTQGTNEDGNAQ